MEGHISVNLRFQNHPFMKILAAFLAIITCGTLCSQENYNLTVRGHLTFPGRELANIGGYIDSLGNEYALVGTSTGLSIVDVTDPDNPVMSFEVNGVTSIWREVKTWQGFAYVTTEGTNGGLTVIDLRELPDTIYSHVYRGDGAINNQLSKSHTLHIDNGYCYVYGSNIGVGGALFLSLADPWNPVYMGRYNEHYIHDGYVSGDTIWGSHVYQGFLSAIDVSDKSNPVTITTQTTPGNFTHNSWLTDDHNTVLTTDEVPNSFLTSYSIDDIGNISELDRFQTAPGSNCIVHNTHVLNDYAVTSWYTEGVVVVDAARPANLIEVGKNDFTPFEGNTFNGCWGVYPFLPSGNLVASDMEGGLFILTPNYVRGCYLEGIVRDANCGALLEGVTVSIVEINVSEQSKIDGTYRTGTAFPGVYTIAFSKPGYDTYTIPNVTLANGVLTEFTIDLVSPTSFALDGLVSNDVSAPIDQALVSLSDGTSSYQLNTNNLGEYVKCDMIPGTYQLVIGKWGFETTCVSDFALSSSNNEVQTQLNTEYFDDFQFNYGWTVSSTAGSGLWERAIPVETNLSGVISNPGTDVSGDCNSFAYVTGNAAGTGPGTDDIDDGYTKLTSPEMDLSTYTEPFIWFHRWFFNGGGNDSPNDTLYVKLTNNGGAPVTVKKIVQDTNSSQWIPEVFKVSDYIANPGMVKFILEATDFPNGHIVEAGLDRFYVTDSFTVNIAKTLLEDAELVSFPNPSTGLVSVKWHVSKTVKQAKLELCDLQGRVIQDQRLVSDSGVTKLGLNVDSGIYLMRLIADDRIVRSEKIVITQ